MTSAPEWLNDIERTLYVDEVFSTIGRLLYIATCFESYCKSASSIILLKQNVQILDDNELFNKFLSELEKKWLNDHIKNIKTVLISLLSWCGFGDSSQKLLLLSVE